jgi:hypothetical protein
MDGCSSGIKPSPDTFREDMELFGIIIFAAACSIPKPMKSAVTERRVIYLLVVVFIYSPLYKKIKPQLYYIP